MSLIAAVLLLVPQEDISSWIDMLGHESIERRDAAMRHLHALGLPVVARLEKAAGEIQDPERRARLMYVVGAIRKTAEFKKVFGPTRRVTKSCKSQRMKDVLFEILGKSEMSLKSAKVDMNKRIDLEIRDATWWEALDRTVRAAGLRYEVEGSVRSGFGLILLSGAGPDFPAVYQEQFRVSVVETQRLEFRAPDRAVKAGLVVVEVLHQPNLKPASRFGHWPVRIESARDATGADVLLEKWPLPLGGSRWEDEGKRFQADAWISPEATFPVTLQGTADILFDHNVNELVLEREGTGSVIEVGGVSLRIDQLEVSEDGVEWTVHAHPLDPDAPLNQMVENTCYIEDNNGVKHRAAWGTMDRPYSGGRLCGMGTRGGWKWFFHIRGKIAEPKRIHFKWAGPYRVRFPFRLEGITIP